MHLNAIQSEQQRAPSVLMLYGWSFCSWLTSFMWFRGTRRFLYAAFCARRFLFQPVLMPHPLLVVFFPLIFFHCDRCLFFLLQVLMAGLRDCASYGVIIHSRGWLPKVELLQAPNLHMVMQLLNFKIITTVFIRLTALGAYQIFGPWEWVLIWGGRLLEAGGLLNFHHFQQV